MNTEGCPPGWATDQMFVYNASVGKCDMSVPLFVIVTFILMVIKLSLAILHIRAWRRRQRKVYAKVERRKHFPIVPTLSVLGALVYWTLFPLSYANVINTENGWTYAIYAVGWVWFGLMSVFFFLKIVRLGRRLIPIIQEKRRNQILEQMVMDDIDPPTFSSDGRRIAALSSNPLFEDDPPTYDENSNSQPSPENGTPQNPNIPHVFFAHHRQLFGQGMTNSRIMLENKMASGKRMFNQQVKNGRFMFSKRPPPKAMLSNKVSADPPKNPMWEEDPPTTYSILDIVEPQLDRLKRLDIIGQLFFTNAIVALAAQFVIFFIILAFVSPGSYSYAKMGFAFQATFLFQHAVSMNYQFQRVIYGVRESRRASRRNENIEMGLKKLRNQQLTIFILSFTCAIIYVLMASGTVEPNWYWHVIIMYFDAVANLIIYRTLSSKLRSKISELKKQQKAQRALQQLVNPGDASPRGAQAATAAAPNSPANAAVLAGNNFDPHDDGAEQAPRIFKSSVHHVRESAKFVTTDTSERKDKDEKAAESVVPSF